jgi:hypothetical protein
MRVADEVPTLLPWQIEGVFLCVVPVAFGFGVWQIIDEVNEKAELYSQVLGFPVDFMSIIMTMRPLIVISAALYAAKVYWNCRSWFIRKLNAIG